MEDSSGVQDLNGTSTDVGGMDAIGPQPRARPSLLDVLMPATPPQPKNARVVRLFDYEAAKNDPQPQVEAQPEPLAQPAAVEMQPKAKAEPRGREAAKAARNQSLLAAAGFLR